MSVSKLLIRWNDQKGRKTHALKKDWKVFQIIKKQKPVEMPVVIQEEFHANDCPDQISTSAPHAQTPSMQANSRAAATQPRASRSLFSLVFFTFLSPLFSHFTASSKNFEIPLSLEDEYTASQLVEKWRIYCQEKRDSDLSRSSDASYRMFFVCIPLLIE